MSHIDRKQMAEESVRLAELISMIKVEQSGMTNRGGPIRPRIAKEFNLSRYAGYDEFISVICNRKAEIRNQLEQL